MFNPTLIVTLVTLPAIFAQTNTTGTTNTTTVTSTTNTTSQSNDSSAASSTPFTPTNFTPAVVSGTTCGSAQQNLNQCITKVGKDISSCTDNTCLCQTYANIAACYNGCAELVDQGKQYQAQSTQYCTVAGVKPNNTVAATTPTTPTSTTSTPSTSTNTTPVRTNTTSSPTTNAGTFSAAKAGAMPGATVSPAGLYAVLFSGIIAICL